MTFIRLSSNQCGSRIAARQQGSSVREVEPTLDGAFAVTCQAAEREDWGDLFLEVDIFGTDQRQGVGQQ
ncbi:MAG: hypothetical protein MK108_17865 [Mariniblastus sp.]|nr:hypothetical protein [Mariniblastus sp.]